MSTIGETFIDRVVALERRIAALEAALQTGVLGTDQTIKASHDRLDSLLGAGVAAPDGTLVSNLNADMVDGYHAGNGASQVLVLDGSGLVPLADIPATLTGKDADTVDGYHAGNGAGEVLVLDGSGLVPLADIPATLTGKDADTLDGYHASSLTDSRVAVSYGESSATQDITLTSWRDISAPQLSIGVQSGDIVLAIMCISYYGTVRGGLGQFRLNIGGNYPSVAMSGRGDGSGYSYNVTCVYRATASSSTTWTVKGQAALGTAGDTLTLFRKLLLALRIRGSV